MINRTLLRPALRVVLRLVRLQLLQGRRERLHDSLLLLLCYFAGLVRRSFPIAEVIDNSFSRLTHARVVVKSRDVGI